MGSYYFQMDELSVGYNGKPLIEHINIGIKNAYVQDKETADESFIPEFFEKI